MASRFQSWALVLGKLRTEKRHIRRSLSRSLAGYRHIDTAAIYKNEESVGRAIKDSGIRVKSLHHHQAWNSKHTYEEAMKPLTVWSG